MSCSICKESCEDSSPKTIIVGEKGRQTLVTSSLERNDGLHKTFESATPLRIHVQCRKQYTRRSSITSAKRKSECHQEEEDNAPELRSSTPIFDIKSDCFFCTEPVTQNAKLAKHRKRAVSNVETLEFQTKILKLAKERQDKWGSDVTQRIQHVYDLVAAEAKYHRQCAQLFYKIKGNEENQNENQREEAFSKLCQFLDDNDECQYSLQELSEWMDKYLDGNEGYSNKQLNRKLKEHYGEEIVITSLAGKSKVVSFRDSAHRILHEKWITDKVIDTKSQSDRIIDMAASIILNDIRLTIYDCDEYASMEATDNGATMIPNSLQRFLHKLVDRKGKSHSFK